MRKPRLRANHRTLESILKKKSLADRHDDIKLCRKILTEKMSEILDWLKKDYSEFRQLEEMADVVEGFRQDLMKEALQKKRTQYKEDEKLGILKSENQVTDLSKKNGKVYNVKR